MRTRHLLAIAMWFLAATGLFANPLVEIPKGDYSCVVEVAQRNATTREKRKKVTIIQVGNVRLDITHWSDGSTSQLWSLLDRDISLFENNRGNKEVFVLRGGYRNGHWPMMLRFNEESFRWIAASAFIKKGSTARELYYKATVTLDDNEEGNPRAVPYQAWINAKTLLPLKMDDGDALYTLKFNPAPDGALIMPKNVQAELKRWDTEHARHPHL